MSKIDSGSNIGCTSLDRCGRTWALCCFPRFAYLIFEWQSAMRRLLKAVESQDCLIEPHALCPLIWDAGAVGRGELRHRSVQSRITRAVHP